MSPWFETYKYMGYLFTTPGVTAIPAMLVRAAAPCDVRKRPNFQVQEPAGVSVTAAEFAGTTSGTIPHHHV